jgi:E-phenylitaconyl-CoA hydratase
VIIVADKSPILELTINNPEKMNAIKSSDTQELTDALIMMAERDDLRVCIITGAGSRAFAAGADVSGLSGLSDLGSRFWRTPDRGYGLNFETGRRLWKPIIAAINGYCLGQGFVIALGADIRICSENAIFGMPEVKRGVNSASGAHLLRQTIGASAAAEIVLAGVDFNADEALRSGIVSRVYPLDDLMDEARKLANRVAAMSPLAVQASKEVLVRSVDMTLEESMALGYALRMPVVSSEDFTEGMNAFKERRQAVFKGR